MAKTYWKETLLRPYASLGATRTDDGDDYENILGAKTRFICV